ncbi:hypothetical protein [Pseudonocardia sp. NPDC049635]|uniref:hypothetical protein n=1 Tax=Pseudonocardia sp. NPDC049635 TaxID=3155506 RepID=UPI0033D71677
MPHLDRAVPGPATRWRSRRTGTGPAATASETRWQRLEYEAAVRLHQLMDRPGPAAYGQQLTTQNEVSG